MNRSRSGLGVIGGIVLLVHVGIAIAGPWDMDTTYGDAGLVTYDADGEVQARVLPDGTILEVTTAPTGAVLGHRDMNGRRDSAFGAGGKVQISFPAGFSTYDRYPYVDSDGRLLWCGYMDANNDGVRDATLLRYTSAGNPDPAFGSRGVVSQVAAPSPVPSYGAAGEYCDSLAIQPDGRIVAVVARHDSAIAQSLLRFNPDGGADLSFGAGKGAVSISMDQYEGISNLRVLPNGWITMFGGIHEYTFDAGGTRVTGPRGNPDLPAPSHIYDDPIDWQVLGIPGSGDMLLVGNDNGRRQLVFRENSDGSGVRSLLVRDNPPPPAGEGPFYTFVTASLSLDGQRLYLMRYDFNFQGEPGRGEILRLIVSGARAGQMDAEFGVGGSIPWPFPGFALTEQSAGEVVLVGTGKALRLSAVSGPSPGVLGFTNGGGATGQEYSSHKVRVVRAAGHDGAVSVSYRTADNSSSGKAGVNYQSAAGQLHWADGDSSDRLITLQLQKGAADLLPSFFLRLDHPQGASLLQDEAIIGVKGAQPASAGVSTSNFRQLTDSGGGGSTDPLLLLMLLLLAGSAALRARMRLAMTGLFMFAGGEHVMAGPWDMDTTYGQDGLVAGVSWEVKVTPGGSLLQQTRTENALILKQRDANGLPDLQFGSGGQLEIPFPAGVDPPYRLPLIDASGRYLWCGRTDVNGDGVGDMAIWRFTADGKPDTGFGVDGIASRATDPLPAGATSKYGDWCYSLAVQADGRIVAGVGSTFPGPGEGSGSASVRRFNSDGSVDTSFGAGTGRVQVVSNGYNYVEVKVLPGGTILARPSDGYGDYNANVLIDSTGVRSSSPWVTPPSDVPWQALGSENSGYLLVGQSRENLLVARLLPDGSLDKSFGGSVTGIVSVNPNPSPAVPSTDNCCAGWYQTFLSEDGQRLYFSYIYYGRDGLFSGELGRLHAAGVLAGQRDDSFGVHGSVPFAAPLVRGLQEQSPDNLLVIGDGGVFRLSAYSGSSPGLIALRSSYLSTRYGTTPSVQVARIAGDDGAVSVSFRTGDDPAATSRIYEPVSGQLQWAGGDSADKSISVRVLPQVSAVGSGFDLMLENPVGGALLQLRTMSIRIEPDPAPMFIPQPNPAASAPVDSSGIPGGGGSTDALSLLLLLLGAGAAMRARAGPIQ